MTDELSVEQKAEQLGWVPKERFRGPEETWVDAETFVRRGEEILPIVNANNKRLQRELAETAKQVQELKGLVEAGNDSLKAFQEFHTESLQRALEQQRIELTQQLQDARNNGEAAAVVQLEDQLDDLKQQQKDLKVAQKAEAEVKKPVPVTNTEVDPVFAAWNQENTWFGTDKRKTAYANAVALELREDPSKAHLTGRKFFDAVADEVKKVFEPDAGQQHERVEAGGRNSGSNSGRGRDYNSLPAEAKVACDRYAEKLVGKGRSFENLSDWRAQYAKDYYAGE